MLQTAVTSEIITKTKACKAQKLLENPHELPAPSFMDKINHKSSTIFSTLFC